MAFYRCDRGLGFDTSNSTGDSKDVLQNKYTKDAGMINRLVMGYYKNGNYGDIKVGLVRDYLPFKIGDYTYSLSKINSSSAVRKNLLAIGTEIASHINEQRRGITNYVTANDLIIDRITTDDSKYIRSGKNIYGISGTANLIPQEFYNTISGGNRTIMKGSATEYQMYIDSNLSIYFFRYDDLNIPRKICKVDVGNVYSLDRKYINIISGKNQYIISSKYEYTNKIYPDRVNWYKIKNANFITIMFRANNKTIIACLDYSLNQIDINHTLEFDGQFNCSCYDDYIILWQTKEFIKIIVNDKMSLHSHSIISDNTINTLFYPRIVPEFNIILYNVDFKSSDTTAMKIYSLSGEFICEIDKPELKNYGSINTTMNSTRIVSENELDTIIWSYYSYAEDKMPLYVRKIRLNIVEYTWDILFLQDFSLSPSQFGYPLYIANKNINFKYENYDKQSKPHSVSSVPYTEFNSTSNYISNESNRYLNSYYNTYQISRWKTYDGYHTAMRFVKIDSGISYYFTIYSIDQYCTYNFKNDTELIWTRSDRRYIFYLNILYLLNNYNEINITNIDNSNQSYTDYYFN